MPYNISMASNWPGRDWLWIDMGADSRALGADGRLGAQIEALDEVVVVAWEYRIFLRYSCHCAYKMTYLSA